MKNMLIPTTFEEDTLTAVKTAIKYAQGKNCSLILMQLQKIPDTYSSISFLRETTPSFTKAQEDVLERCRQTVAQSGNCRLKVHNQCGISVPLLRNLTKYLNIGLVILTPSYKNEKAAIHKDCKTLLQNSKCSLLHLEANNDEYEFTKALYLEHTKVELGINELQRMITEQFPLKIVSQARIEEENPADIEPFLSETIAKNNIDILIEARKSSKKRSNTTIGTNHNLGLPLLSIYADAAV